MPSLPNLIYIGGKLVAILYVLSVNYMRNLWSIFYFFVWVKLKGVWFGAPLSYKPDMQRISKFDVWLLALSSNSAIPNHVRKEVLASVSIICWEIWKERCNAFLLTFPSRSWYCAQEIKILPYLGRWIQNLPTFGLSRIQSYLCLYLVQILEKSSLVVIFRPKKL